MTIKIYMLDTTSFWKDYEAGRQKPELLSSFLSVNRQQKIQRFRYAQGKALSLGAGLLLDYGLREYGLREKDVVLSYGSDEKPYLQDYPMIHFNLSHSNSMAMAVFGDQEIGCDVEQIGTPDYRIVRRFFAEEEAEVIEEQINDREKTRMFYRFWTLKESFLKVTGKGIRMPLNDFSILLGSAIQVKYIGEIKPYTFQEFFLPDYQAALCIKGIRREIPTKIQFLAPQDIF
ncbi:MAG: 4'-phosphopantetheinyl transferase superfamily protein [Lachnospiraceae bacterium]|nr:4'-phosphopantetheinyl transferase superfamily protein [Lachnospiraceae bacterium]